jgi:hypothetical protein
MFLIGNDHSNRILNIDVTGHRLCNKYKEGLIRWKDRLRGILRDPHPHDNAERHPHTERSSNPPYRCPDRNMKNCGRHWPRDFRGRHLNSTNHKNLMSCTEFTTINTKLNGADLSEGRSYESPFGCLWLQSHFLILNHTSSDVYKNCPKIYDIKCPSL